MAAALLSVEASLAGRAWHMRLDAAGERLAERLMEAFGLNPYVARAAAGRGVTEETLENFLTPSLARDLPDPYLLKDMETAAVRLTEAIIAGEKIAVFGDYDVDGATSSALAARFLKSVGHEAFEIYIPDRVKEGYGPNTKAMLALKERGAKVVVTVDCGTLAHAPLREAKDAGLDVIVCDHHLAEGALPEALAIINPNRMDEGPALRNLAAVGVVFLLLVAVNRELRVRGFFKMKPESDLKTMLDIVALGTVADVVALTGLNRTLVAQGLKVMGQRKNIGLKALMDVARLNERPNAYHLGFLLG
ncbi:MAG TPA: DHH family phosphoesterase, partial [Sphingomonadales bacterium]|nr:DHH family phosphoesterase [Sphingomonadales bacterium]